MRCKARKPLGGDEVLARFEADARIRETPARVVTAGDMTGRTKRIDVPEPSVLVEQMPAVRLGKLS